MSFVPLRHIAALCLIACFGASAQNIPISMTAIAATHEGRDEPFIDKALDAVRDAIAAIKEFDTYRAVKSAKTSSPLKNEASIQITPQYTLYCTPQLIDDDGRILTNIRIEMAPKDEKSKPVNVVKLNMHAVPGDKINILGPKIDDATLLVVLTIGAKS